jgi:formate hydrogenlyase transcriptional activator
LNTSENHRQLKAMAMDLMGELIKQESAAKITSTINENLKNLVTVMQVDRCILFELDRGRVSGNAVYSYMLQEIDNPLPKLTEKKFPWIFEKIRNGEIVGVSRQDDLPPEAAKDLVGANHIGLKSFLTIPLFIRNDNYFVLTFGSFRNEKKWDKKLLPWLRTIGEILSSSLLRLQALKQIQDRISFEKLISHLSASFINIAAQDVDDTINRGLMQIAEFLKVERGSLLKLSKKSKNIHVVNTVGIEGISLVDKNLEIEKYPWASRKLKNLKAIRIENIESLPASAKLEKEWASSQGIKSILCVPFASEGKLIGAISFDALRTTRIWTDELVNRVRLIGEIFANAMLRKKNDIELNRAFDKIKKLKKILQSENRYLKDRIDFESSPFGIIGSSPEINSALNHVKQVASTNSTVLIEGETGVGKELFAKAIHQISHRKDRTMVKVNCAALPASLIESELFGREKGAFTGAIARQAGRFETADGSTIFLDEISEMPFELQAKLLRVLQEGQFERLGSAKSISVDMRLITATNKNLNKLVREGKFREDLYFRINVFPIRVPPLRERKEDIPTLVWAFVKQFEESMGKRFDTIPKEIMSQLQQYSWPGNVRELKNAVEYGMIVSKNRVLKISIPEAVCQSEPVPSDLTLKEMEKYYISSVLEKSKWRIRGVGGAAEKLNVHPNTLYSKMKKLGIKRPQT